ncbi:MAG: nucleotidyltransferase family protein [Anaerolineae bacterium]|nr:nucleotidyltransferase family protein [Anaerolineae bacterium]
MRSLGVQRLGIFGSYVRGEQTDASDVDLLVEFEAGKKTFDRFMRLAFYLEDLLEQPVELVTPESVSPYIRPYINSELQYVPLMD